MSSYAILIPANIAEKCFLLEGVYWRAFGRVPLEHYTGDGPYREDPDLYDGIETPFSSDAFLTDAECFYADLPPDPYGKAMEEGLPTDVALYERLLDLSRGNPKFSEDDILGLERDLELAKVHDESARVWDAQCDQYLDEFRTEICLDLRREKLHAFGRKLPHPDPDKSLEELGAKDLWLDSLKVVPVPPQAWVSQQINWDDGAVFGPQASYIWIYLSVDELLERYPPENFIKSGSAYMIGGSVAVAGYQPTSTNMASRRGRPPLPWDDFHVEVARLYAIGEMPLKKEAAIALLREWFREHKQKDVSRSAIGAKLKPYFDKIGRKSAL